MLTGTDYRWSVLVRVLLWTFRFERFYVLSEGLRLQSRSELHYLRRSHLKPGDYILDFRVKRRGKPLLLWRRKRILIPELRVRRKLWP